RALQRDEAPCLLRQIIRTLGRERGRAAKPLERFPGPRGGQVRDADQEMRIGMARLELEELLAGRANTVQVAAAELVLGRAMPAGDGVLPRVDGRFPRARSGSGILSLPSSDAARCGNSGATRSRRCHE